MPAHASNADRIARAAAEAAAGDREKAEKKQRAAAAKAAKPAKKKAPSAGPARLKVIWAVGRPGLEPVKTYAYKEREAADAEAAKRGGDYRVVGVKVPMQ